MGSGSDGAYSCRAYSIDKSPKLQPTKQRKVFAPAFRHTSCELQKPAWLLRDVGLSLRQVIEGMGNNSKVSYLNLSYSREVNDQHLLKLARALLSNSTLCTLNLAGCNTISDQGDSDLKHLDLSWCESLTDITLTRAAAALERNFSLQVAKFACCILFSDAGFSAIAK
ncbi:MAG: hypothetical protein SGPRY_004228, partial [Prymnesium sp.]